MWYVTVKKFEYMDQRGSKCIAESGDMVDILNRHEAGKLLAKKLIKPRPLRKELKKSPAQTAPPKMPPMAVLIDEDGSKRKCGAFRVLKNFDWKDQRGAKISAKVGEVVDVLNRHDAEQLLALGYIGARSSSSSGMCMGTPSAPFKVTQRIGIWIVTSNNYSGGRIHMYQYAWSLANSGAEVWIITNSIPIWMRDYPVEPNLHIAIEGVDKIPVDLDLIVTDSKGNLGKKALSWKHNHPKIPFVCFNFETPNWVGQYEKGYANRLQAPRDVFLNADYLLANSDLSKKYLLEWLGKDIPCGVLNPAVNTFALNKKLDGTPNLPKNPYAVFSARSATYKGGSSVMKALWQLKKPFDLVVFGNLPSPLKDTAVHRLYSYKHKGDVEKFTLMKNAEVVLAPSKFEGYGMVPGEALASGTPCIVYDLPVLREAYGDDLIYVKWGDEKAFCDKVKQVLSGGNPTISTEVSARVEETKGMDAMQKTIETLKFHSIKKKIISVHMICYWGFIPESIESVYPHVDEILIAYGPTKLNKDVPPDGSLEAIQNFPDPDGKIRLEVRDVWKDKKQMRQWCTDQLCGNYHLLLDADEIWVGLDKWIASDVMFSSPRWINLWHSGKHWVYDTAKMAGLRWGRKLDPYGSVCPHYRWSWWRRSYYWRKHPAVVDMNNVPLHCVSPVPAKSVKESAIYHLGHVLPEGIMLAKHEFYRKRDGDDAGRRNREKCWHEWNGKEGDSGDGMVAKVDWSLPDIVKRGIQHAKELKI